MIRLAALVLSVLLLAGCGQVRPIAPPGCAVIAYRLLPSAQDPRAFLTENRAPREFGEVLLSRLRTPQSVPNAPRQVLVLSGGGQHGAFGAGFFLGLPHVPDYQVVTGVSTGSLQSTFVFLANQPEPADRTALPAYMSLNPDLGKPGQSNLQDLALAYAIEKEGDLMKVGSPLRAVNKGSIATFGPLHDMLQALITHDTIVAVAAEARKGRSLFVGITDLDDGYGYAVDLTEMAKQAVDAGTVDNVIPCYIDSLIASSTVPPGVPPVSLNVAGAPQADMFMDGGARFGVFFDQLRNVAKSDGSTDMTVIVNGSLYGGPWLDDKGQRISQWSVASFGLRAVDMMENQVYRLSVGDAEQWAVDNGTLRMAFISNEKLRVMTSDPDQWVYDGRTCAAASAADAASKPLQFHPKYMRCLIDYGQKRGQRDPWNKVLPPSAK
jgi:predicted acylesterase/phospholipase RssA